MKCVGWAYEACDNEAYGSVFEGSLDGSWTSRPSCLEHWLEFTAAFESLTEVPIVVEFLSTEAPPPWWTRRDRGVWLRNLLAVPYFEPRDQDASEGNDDAGT